MPKPPLDTRTGLCGVNTCHRLTSGATLTLPVTGYTDPTTLLISVVVGKNSQRGRLWLNSANQEALGRLLADRGGPGHGERLDGRRVHPVWLRGRGHGGQLGHSRLGGHALSDHPSAARH